ncbi:MAG TPA: carbohydrate ABC transporter permease [Thermotogota bacterium]|nr:carbohydrate ABC transporter permease [Thermotogota bacterium]NLZ13953.1 carbohydrate ABC transporter permease [Thermotogaceae bacterium]MDD8041290.1 carbohydrate ABC transporter permease [Thermotogota bacterium]MDD8054191.1 carbohydrate ABC transporter permease [Thermotogota bacterium]HNR64242.1 carbohydrate ABC transporter permease [Thermotogota bacterium]
MNRKRVSGFAIVNGIILSVVLVSALYPFLNLLAVSFTGIRSISDISGMAVLPKSPTLDYYKALLGTPYVQRAFFNSVYITALGTLINMALTILTAYALSRDNFFGKKVFTIFLIIPMLFNPGIIPNYMLIKNLALIDKYWAVILPGAINVYYTMLLRNIFLSVPKSIYEAAEIDGARHFTMIWKIAVPLSKPGVITIALFYAINHWNDYFKPLIYISDPAKWPLQVLLRQFIVDADKASLFGPLQSVLYAQGESALPFRGLQSAIIIITVIPILLLYPLLLRYFTSGLVSGAEKG